MRSVPRLEMEDTKKRINQKSLFWFIFVSLFSALALFVWLLDYSQIAKAVSPPTIITYQGKLLQSNTSVTTSVNMKFVIYDDPTAGSALYTAAGTLPTTSTISVTPTQGIFTVDLGGSGTNSLSASIFASNTNLYLEVTVEGQILSPRKQLTAAPFALNSEYLLGISASSTSSSTYIPHSDSSGNFLFTGTPNASTVAGGVLYINPATAGANNTLFGIAVGGGERFRVDEDGDAWLSGNFFVTGTLSVTGTTQLNNDTTILGDLFVGAASESLTNTNFSLNGDDMYVADLLGVGDTLYVENDIYIGTSTLRLNGNVTGGLISQGAGTLTIDSAGQLQLNTTNNQNIITGSGSFGINSSSPNYQLSVDGTFGVFGTSTLFRSLFVGSASENITTSTFVLNGDDMYVADLLGVGNSLFVENDIYIGTSTLRLNGNNTGGLITMTNGSLTIDSDTVLNLNTINNQNIVLGSGNVGINSSTPNYNLSVSGTTYINGASTFFGTSTFVGDTILSGGNNNFIGEAASPQSIGSVVFGDTSGRIAIQGDYAYVGHGLDGTTLTVVDISDKTNPFVVATTTLTRAVSDLAISGDYLYVAGDNGLSVFEINNPVSPLPTYDTPAAGFGYTSAEQIEISGNLAFVKGSGSAFGVLDISNPYDVKFVALSTISSSPTNMEVYGRYLFVTYETIGAVDAYELRASLGTFSPAGSISSSTATLVQPTGIGIRGKYAYVARGDNLTEGITILDISNPTAMAEIGSYSTSNAIFRDVKLVGDYLYVADVYNNWIWTFDVSSSTNPTFSATTTLVTGASAGFNGPQFLDTQGGYLYAATAFQNGFEILDISGANISNANVGSITTGKLRNTGETSFEDNVYVRGGLSVGNNGLLISGDIGLSKPESSIVSTNTIRFSHSALFETTMRTSTDNHAFVFNTFSELPSSSSRYLLSVRNGGLPAFSVATNGDVHVGGTISAFSATIGTPGTPGDLAERVDIAIDDLVEPGDVVIVDPDYPDTYRRSAGAYEQEVAGVISTNPTIVVGNGRTANTAVMAMVGRVPIKVSNENGPIRRGDLLVSASLPGYAMRYDSGVDSGQTVVSIIGVALDNFSTSTPSSTGRIMGLIRTGWVYNHNQSIASMQAELMNLASSQGTNLQTNNNLTVSEQNNQIAFLDNSNLDLNWHDIVNVREINGEGWQIDEYGRFVSNINVGGGEVSLYAVQSEGTQFIISGSDSLVAGRRRIDFATNTRSLIDDTKPINVSITLTSEANGVYVMNKDRTGFTVREINGGFSTASFDWVVVAERLLEFVDPSLSSNLNPSTVSNSTNNNPQSSSEVLNTLTSTEPNTQNASSAESGTISASSTTQISNGAVNTTSPAESLPNQTIESGASTVPQTTSSTVTTVGSLEEVSTAINTSSST